MGMGRGTKKAVSIKYYYHRLKNDNCNTYSNLREGAQKSNGFKTFFSPSLMMMSLRFCAARCQKARFCSKTPAGHHWMCGVYQMRSDARKSHRTPYLLIICLLAPWTAPHSSSSINSGNSVELNLIRESLHLRKIIQSSQPQIPKLLGGSITSTILLFNPKYDIRAILGNLMKGPL